MGSGQSHIESQEGGAKSFSECDVGAVGNLHVVTQGPDPLKQTDVGIALDGQLLEASKCERCSRVVNIARGEATTDSAHHFDVEYVWCEEILMLDKSSGDR